MLTTIFCFTKKGAILMGKIRDYFPHSECYSKYKHIADAKVIEGNLSLIVQSAFKQSDSIVFIGAAGIAVRLIAPYIKTKDKDPGVIVIDENGDYVIPILSGHLGGANQTALRIAREIGGQAIITTATDINQVFAVDVWAKEQNLFIHNIDHIKYISAALLQGEKIGFICDYKVESEIPEFIGNGDTKVGIVISEELRSTDFTRTLSLSPKNYVVGIGCRKGIPEKVLEDAVLHSLQQAGVTLNRLKAVATIDIKKCEQAIRAFCDKYKLELVTYSAEELNQVKGNFTASEFVKGVVGVDNVCERAAFLASEMGEFLKRKTSSNGVTTALTKIDWRCRF